MPKRLLPKINKAGTIKPINGPAIYQGQGCLIHSLMQIISLKIQQTIYRKFDDKHCLFNEELMNNDINAHDEYKPAKPFFKFIAGNRFAQFSSDKSTGNGNQGEGNQ